MNSERRSVIEVIFFALIGIFASVCHFVVAIAVIEYIGLQIWLANIIGFACAFPISLAGHANLTFQAQHYGREAAITKKATRRFLITAVTGGILNEAGVILLVELFDVPHRYAIGGMIVLVAGMIFLLSKFWAFKDKGDDPG